jgi:nitroreductase
MPEYPKVLDPKATLALIRRRRSIRRYRPDPIPDEMVEQLLEAGRWAPSAGNRQPWSIIVVRDEAIRQEVARHAAYYVIRWAHVSEAPLLLVLCGNTRGGPYRAYLHEDVGLAGSQIMLQAEALGLGTCWIGGLDRKAIAGILNVPSYLEIVGLLTVGFPAETPDPTPRKPLPQIVHYDVYGNREPGAKAMAGRLPGGWLSRWLRRLRVAYRS